MALLDTTVLVDLTRSFRSPAFQRAHRRVGELLARGEAMCTSRVNEAELRVGPERAEDRPAELVRVERVLAGVVILEFDAAAARLYATIKGSLLDRGMPAGDCDTMIAAVAMTNGQILVTRNPAHFTAIAGLAVSAY